MKLPLQISFKNLARNDQIISIIKERTLKFKRLCHEIIQCRVIVSVPHRSHRSGNFYAVHVEVSLPGKTIIVDHEDNSELENKDVRHVLRVAFDAANRQIEDYVKRHVA